MPVTLSVLIPTLSGREQYLRQTVDGYLMNTPADVDLEFVILRDRPTCGIGWQEAAQRAHGDLLHFSNDDIYPWAGWYEPLVEVVELGQVAAPWISHGPWGQFYAAPEGQVPTDWMACDHSAMPFMSMEQFLHLSPIVPIHYGVDNWIAYRAGQCGYQIVGRSVSVICHFAAKAGRQNGQTEWTEQDLLDYDCCVALPQYRDGRLHPGQYPEDRLRPEGLARARQWRRENVR